MSFSIFEFYQYSTLQNIQVDLIAAQDIEREVKGYSESLISGIREKEGFNIQNPETLQIENNNISYLFFEGYTERVKDLKNWQIENGVLRDREDRINPYQSNILVFEANSKVYGIVFSGINRAKAITKDCFPAETWGHVLPVENKITEDLLYWIFKRFIDTPRESLATEYQLHVTALESYMGKTRDNVNAMRGEGSRISTILGTLAFLFNNEELRAIRPAIQHGNEKVLLEIGLTGTFKTWSNAYRGQHFRTITGQRKENAIAIFIFLKILPSLAECYKYHKDKDQWSPQLKVDFLKRLGTMIRDEVDSVLIKIEQENLDIDENEGILDSDYEEFELEIEDDDDEVIE
ncbi:hypothetical protein [Sporosarcina sp. FSL K6-3457]|uniref:hypothetical protein n=1 Tax=Sporosarcina sp. FSL K6-3457 TaxID=2978204 RepID=UPI0030FAF8AF